MACWEMVAGLARVGMSTASLAGAYHLCPQSRASRKATPLCASVLERATHGLCVRFAGGDFVGQAEGLAGADCPVSA